MQQKLVDLPVMKRCSKCKEEKLATKEFFYWHSGKKKFEKTCKICTVKDRAEYRKNNRCKIREAARKKYYKDIDKSRSQRNEYYHKNPDKQKIATKTRYYEIKAEGGERWNRLCAQTKIRGTEWRKDNKQHLSDWHKKRRLTLRGRFMEYKNNKGKLWKFSWEQWQVWYESKQLKCFYCDIPEEYIPKMGYKKFGHIKRLTLDKLDPKGFYSPDNCEWACMRCNEKKADDLTPEETRQIAQSVLKPKWQKELGITP